MTPSERTPVPEEIAAQLLFESDSTCCVCRAPYQRVQIHHLDDDPRNHAIENLAVLCLDCHLETQLEGGFDRKLNAAQIRLYRADWVSRVKQRRSEFPTPGMPRSALADMIRYTHTAQLLIERADLLARLAPSATLRDCDVHIVDSLLYKLDELRDDDDIEDAVCGALVAWGAMVQQGNRRFELRGPTECDPGVAQAVRRNLLYIPQAYRRRWSA